MKRVFVDTNIVIDLLSRSEPFCEEATVLFSLADKKQIELSVSALTMVNTSCVLLKQMNPTKTKSILQKLRMIVKVLALNDKIFELASNDETFPDVEDGLQYFTALETAQDFFLTRNLNDFKNSRLPIMTAKQFIKTLS